jgi:hypothetical protein
MTMNYRMITLSVLLAMGSTVAPDVAVAGNLTNAALACYVDTAAFDQLTTGLCASVSGNGPDPTIAHFEVVGLTAGSYSFVWKDLDTGVAPPGCGNSFVCNTGIASEAAGDGLVRMSVLITDLGTGLTKTVTARARFIS